MLGQAKNKTYGNSPNIINPNPSFYEMYTPFTPSPNAILISEKAIEENVSLPNPSGDIDKRINNLNLLKFSDPYNIETLLGNNNKMPIKEMLMDQASFALVKYGLDRDFDLKLQIAYALADYVYIYFGRDALENLVLSFMGLKDKKPKEGELNQAMLVKLLLEAITLPALIKLAEMVVGGQYSYTELVKLVGGSYVINYGYEMIMKNMSNNN